MGFTAIDLFAGAGGFSTGAEMAGVHVRWAANHWPEAVACHAANHPGATHAVQDLRQADFTKVPDHDVLLAAPACQGHSNAASRGGSGRRGSAPAHDALRSTAWAVIEALDAKRPQFFVVENVPEFMKWRRFDAWRSMIEEDYALSFNVLDSADFGIPQNRNRLYVVGVRGASSPLTIEAPGSAHVAARTIADLDKGRWTRVEDHRSEGVKRRVARAKTRGHGDAWIHQNVTGHPGRSLDRPFQTITTKHQLALVRNGGEEYRPLSKDEYRKAMGFPVDYVLPKSVTASVKMLGNAVVPRVACYVLNQIQLRG